MTILASLEFLIILLLLLRIVRFFRTENHYNRVLDFIFRKYSLNLSDPYVLRPGFEDRRCHHCLYPLGHGHAADCVWQTLQKTVIDFYRT